MGRAYSNDLRERVVRAVIKGGLSRHQAAAQFGVGISTAINWVQRFLETGSVKPDQIGGYRPKKIAGPHREWLMQRCRKDFPCEGWWPNSLSVASRSITARCGSSFTLRSSVIKKDADCRRAGPSRCRPAASAVDQVSGSDRSHSAGVHR
jgi:putative transposase